MLPTLRQLQYLKLLAEHGSFSRAAEAAHVTQPTLSAGIAELERALGAPVVDRARSGVILTAVGEEAVRRAADILARSEDLVQAAKSAGQPLTGRFRLGVIPTIAPFLLPKALPLLRERFPKLKLLLREDLTQRLMEALKSGAMDAALIALPYDTAGLDHAAVSDDELFAITPANHALVAQAKISPAMLQANGLILLEDGHCLRDQALSVCGLNPPKSTDESLFAATSLHTLVQMVGSGLGVSLLPAMAVEAGLANDAPVAVRPLNADYPSRHIVVAWRAGSSREIEGRLIAETLRGDAPRAAAVNTAPLQIEGLAARVAALDVLRAALDHRGGFDEALARAPFNALAPRERGYARALTMVALRRLGPIDRALNARLQKPPPAAVLAILRLGAAQLFYMGAPDFAVVNTCVELAAARPDARPFKGLVNAVLRALARAEPPIDDGQGLAPDWIMARWRSAYGEGDAARIAAMIGDEPATDLTLRDPGEAAVLYEALEATPLPGGGLRAGLRGEVIDWPGFAEGRWWVQDAAAAIPARLLRLQPGENALDLCAAPGGKTLQMAAGGGEVVAVDRSALRLRRAAENLHRVNLSAELIAADAGAWPDPRQFDAVLLDAPCTATGTFRRHPDVLWAGRPSDIAKLAQAQARLLDAAARKVKPGGRLVYCVCSLEPEEGEGQVEPFLKRNTDFTVVPIAPGEGGAPIASITAAGTLRLLPFHIDGGADGFFACRFVRLG